MANTKLPQHGTIARSVIDALICAGPRGAAFTDLLEAYWDAQSLALGDSYRGRGNFIGASRYRRNAMNLNRVLKQHAVKTGRAGSRAPWVAKVYAAQVLYDAITG